jgi:hypothetical protein
MFVSLIVLHRRLDTETSDFLFSYSFDLNNMNK